MQICLKTWLTEFDQSTYIMNIDRERGEIRGKAKSSHTSINNFLMLKRFVCRRWRAFPFLTRETLGIRSFLTSVRLLYKWNNYIHTAKFMGTSAVQFRFNFLEIVRILLRIDQSFARHRWH